MAAEPYKKYKNSGRDRDDIVQEVAERYYLRQQSKTEIAKIMDLSRPTVSKMLDQALEADLVRIRMKASSVPAYLIKLRKDFLATFKWIKEIEGDG